MIKKRISQLRLKFKEFGIDGYIIPKNDEFFSEYALKDRLRTISNFTGSAGFVVILKKKNYLFVDGRYTLQAELECGTQFKIMKYEKILNCKLFKDLILGIDPKLFTSHLLLNTFKKYNKIKEIEKNLIDTIHNKYPIKSKPFFSLHENITGESHLSKIKKVSNYLKRNKKKFLFVSAPENVAWLLNIRGFDNPNSPIPNCRLLINDENKIYFISKLKNLKRLVQEKKIKKQQIIEPQNLKIFSKKFKNKKILIDKKSCSIFYENLFKKNNKIYKHEDPIYFLKSIKNKQEIKNMINSHILDGVALSKFLYWIQKVNKNKITEFDAQNKLENFRKKNNNYLFPSFNTIAGTGSNGAIVHYRASKKKTKIINKKDIFLCDSGGQYKYGTTDVTRTICFSSPKKNIKDVFTKVLKGHIAVANTNLQTHFNGKLIDTRARKFLKQSNLDYEHGTGHGVGFFLNVHEGPQAISKFNSIKISEGMIISNEPGYYKKGKFGIRIENLLFVKKKNKKLFFENLTLAPIEKDLINLNLLNREEKKYLSKYHMNVYFKLSKYLTMNEKKWLASFI